MNQSIFQNLKQYFGHVFLEYVLNKTFGKDLQYDQLGLNINQSQALLELHDLVTFCRTHFIGVGGFGDGARFYLGDYADLYNDLRASCGGLNEEILIDDPLIAYLQKTAIKFYPTLLIKNRAEPDFPILNLSLSLKDCTEFCNLIKSDNINKLTNDGIDLAHSFNFRLSNDVQIMNQVSQGLSGIVLRSFKNISLRMKYSLKDLMVEIENNVTTL